MKNALWLAGILCSAIVRGVAAAPPAQLDSTVIRALETFDTPGVAIAIVEKGAVTLAKGWGQRSLTDTARVDTDTLFRIGSCTKTFTAVLIGGLVDEGKLHWDDRAADVVPGFGLADAYASHEVRLRDLLAHRSGLGRGAGDLLFAPPTIYTRAETLRRLRYVPLAHTLRERFAYNNLGFLAAGEAAAVALHTSWDEALSARILEPLGMRATVTTAAAFGKAANRAVAHVRAEPPRAAAPLQVVSTPAMDNVAPAGAMASSANDMARWLQLLVDGGKFNGVRVISSGALAEMWSLQIPIPIVSPPPALAATQASFSGYGLGWFVRDAGGRKIVFHGGEVLGGRALTLLIPSEQVGFVILANTGESGTVNALTWSLLEHYLALPSHDWIEGYRLVHEQQLSQVQRAPQLASRARNDSGAAALIGTYEDAWYGVVTVRREGSGLGISFDATPSMHGRLEPLRFDLWRTRWPDRTIEDAYVRIVRRADGTVQALHLEPISPTADFSFDYADLFLVRRTQ